MEEFRADGRARSIGVSNFQTQHLERLIDTCDVVPAVRLFDFDLTPQQMAAIDGVDRGEDGRRGPHPERFAYVPS